MRLERGGARAARADAGGRRAGGRGRRRTATPRRSRSRSRRWPRSGCRGPTDRSRPPGPGARGAVGAGASRRRRWPTRAAASRKRDGAGLAERARRPRAAASRRSRSRACSPSCGRRPACSTTPARSAPNGGIKRALAELAAIVAAVERRRLDARLHVDLGEVRGFDYYTGVRFQASCRARPTRCCSGGRYDELLGRYGRPSPAVGFAVDVDAVAGALESSTHDAGEPQRPSAKGMNRGMTTWPS